MAALERHVLEFFDSDNERHVDHARLSTGAAVELLDAAEATLRLHIAVGPDAVRWEQDIRKPAQRVIAAADRDSDLDALRSRAWHLVGRAAERLDRPLPVRQAAINALRCAVATNDTIALENAARGRGRHGAVPGHQRDPG